MTAIETQYESRQEKKSLVNAVSFLVGVGVFLFGINFIAPKLITHYAQTQICDRYTRALTEDLTSIVIQFEGCMTEFER
jgi:hypothetical protein